MIINSRKILIMITALVIITLTTPVLAQDIGLPGGHLITDRWRYAYSQYSGITNPAFVNEENYKSVRALFSSTLDVFTMIEAGFTMPIGLYDAAAVALITHGTSSTYYLTDLDGKPTGKKISDEGYLIAMTYANNVWKGLTLGINADIILQNIADIPAEDVVGNKMRFGFGVDIGATYKLPRHQLYGNHLIGVSTNNLFTRMNESDEVYAAALRFSLLSDFWKRRILFGTDYVMKDLRSGQIDWATGYTSTTLSEYNFKVGANILHHFKLYVLLGLNDEGMDHYGFAFGAKTSRFSYFRGIEGMVQFVSILNDTKDANASHITFSARTEFGKHREEAYISK
jgi:hypothetical protein